MTGNVRARGAAGSAVAAPWLRRKATCPHAVRVGKD